MTDAQNHPSHSSAQRIVVGVDGSRPSVGALRRGVRIAAALDAQLVAVAAWSYPPLYGGLPGAQWSPENDAHEILEHVRDEVFEGRVPDWYSSEVHAGPAAQVLIEASKGAEMLIVGSRGHGGFTGLLLGSVSSACAEYAECDVLVYHDESAETLHREPPAEA